MKIITAYQTIQSPSEGIYTEAGSRFLGYLYPLTTDEEVKQIKDNLRKEHHKAVHVAWACRLGILSDTERSSDDGEPSGSAGKPILNELKSNNITQVCLFVVRYYGGKKLGIPGLIHAYGAAAAYSITSAKVETIPIKECYKISCKEADLHLVIHEVNKLGAKIVSTEFGEICNFIITFNRDKHDKVIGKLETLWQIELAYSHSF